MKVISVKFPCKITIMLFVVFTVFVNSTAQPTRKKRVDTVGIALKMEIKKHLYPSVDAHNTRELAVFVVSPEVDPNSSLRLIEKRGKYYLEVRSLHKNVGNEVLSAFVSHSYKPLALLTDTFMVEVSEKFKKSMLDAFRKTVHEKFTDLFPSQIEIYDGTVYDFWINENAITTSKAIRKDGDAMYFGWKVAKTNLQIINDVIAGVFIETSNHYF